MGGGAVRVRTLGDRNGRKATAYERQNKQLREEVVRLQKVVAVRAQKVADEARGEIARLSAELLSSEQRFRDLAARGPDLIEMHDVRRRGFLGRLWWALGFARTGRMRYERA